MAEEKKVKKPKNPLIGAQTEPSTLDSTTKIGIDTEKNFVDNILAASDSGQLDMSALEDFTSISNARDQIYQLIDTMMQDSSVASIVRTYAEDVCETADNGHIIWCESNDPNISKFINYLLNVMNVDKNIFGWAYSLIKYGDVYLRLFRESDYKDPIFKKDNIEKMDYSRTILTEEIDPEKIKNESVYLQIHAINDPYSYYIEMVSDPGTMFELTKFGKTYGYVETPNEETGFDYLSNSFTGTQPNAGTFNYKMKTNDVHVYQADDFVHACLDDSYSRYPEKVDIFLTEDDYKTGTNALSYTVKRGKSLLYDSYKIWREKSLLEAAALLNRITRSSIVRTIQIEVGDMPKSQVQNTIRRVKELMEQKSAIQTGSGMVEYNNPGAFENNIYLATHNGQGALTIGTVGGDVDVKNLADLDYWNNKFYSSYGIPKQYFGWCLTASTRIPLLNGTTPTIEEMFKNKETYINKGILSCDKDGLLIPTTISNIMLTNEHATKIIRITLDNNETVEVTPDHKMMLRDGTFIEAKDINVNDTLMPYYESITKDGRKVVLNNKTGKYELLFHLVANEKFGSHEKGYQIHHTDENKLNDDFDNLEKLTTAEHFQRHEAMLRKAHKLRNAKQRDAGLPVGCQDYKWINNGQTQKWLKPGEELPEGFVYGALEKSEETKAKMRASRLAILDEHPEYKQLGGFKTGECSEEARQNMSKGQRHRYDSMTAEEKEAHHIKHSAIMNENNSKMQAAKREKFIAQKPDRAKFVRTLRCPICGKTFTKKLNAEEYSHYLNKKNFIFCSAECRNKIFGGGKLNKSYQIYIKNNKNITAYEKERLNGEVRPDMLYKGEKIASIVDQYKLEGYVTECNHTVVKIEEIITDEPVYDLTVVGDAHTFPLAAGIFVHNCDDGAGFNGGSSLTILSSVYAKGVKRVQNALIQAITDAINLILVNKGCKSYLNNFVLKMKTPTTQEEKDYREQLSSKINAISNMQSLFADVEDKSRKLGILKTLVQPLNYGDELTAIIDKEIDEAEAKKEQEKREAEEAAAAENEAGAEEENNEPTRRPRPTPEGDNLPDLGELDLGLSSEAPMADEGFTKNEGNIPLVEDQDLTFDENDLPMPEELNAHKDFSKNE